MDKRDWEIAARRQKIRADEAEEHVEDWRHGVNLLINGSVRWFLVQKDSAGAEHMFGVGVVKNAPINNPLSAALKHRESEDRAVVIWMTTWKLEDGREGKYMSAYSPSDFKKMPAEWKEANEPNETQIEGPLCRAADLVDDALRKYLEHGQPRPAA